MRKNIVDSIVFVVVFFGVVWFLCNMPMLCKKFIPLTKNPPITIEHEIKVNNEYNNTTHAQVVSIDNEVITIVVNGNYYEFIGSGFYNGQYINVVLINDMILDVL